MNNSWWGTVVVPTVVAWLIALCVFSAAMFADYDGSKLIAVAIVVGAPLAAILYQTWNRPKE
jgi:hypothetical protein